MTTDCPTEDATFDLDVDQWAGKTVKFTYKAPNTADPPVLVPVVVTDWTALLQVRDAPGADPILTLTDSAGITVGGTDGSFAVAFSGSQTGLLVATRYFYDLFVIPPSAEPIRLIGGEVYVTLAISVPTP